MYNMEISIGSYKVRVIILIAIVVVFWVMFGHILCGCCRVSLFEGLKIKKKNIKKNLQEAQKAQEEADRAQKIATEAAAKAQAALKKLA